MAENHHPKKIFLCKNFLLAVLVELDEVQQIYELMNLIEIFILVNIAL